MRSQADRSVTPFMQFSLFFVFIALALLTACGGADNRTPPPPAAITIGISPATVSVEVGTTHTFAANVANTDNKAVTWAVQEGATGGTITNAGVYTPPNTEGTFHIVATSQADTTKQAIAAVTTTIATKVTVAPETAAIAINAQHAFTAALTDVTDSSVTWSVKEGAAGGTIDATGTYTAPNKAGTYHVVATSVEHPTKSGSAAVAVSAPAPTFTTTAPTSAVEAEVYTYTVDGVDPAGGTLVFSLAAAPSNATLEGNVLTWTPSAEQARVANNFSIEAVSTEGGSATQTFTVSPAGTIHGQVIRNFVSATDIKQVPVDLSESYIYAYVPAEDGTLTEIEGTGTAEGTFEIPGVAAGNYWLAVDDFDQVLTKLSNIDLSFLVQGRPNATYAAEGTLRELHIEGLSPWKDGDFLEWTIPNIGEWRSWGELAPDSISFDGQQAVGYLADAEVGDRAMLGQWTTGVSNGGRPYEVLTKVLGPMEVTDLDGKTINVAGKMLDVAGTHAFHAAIAGSKFAGLNSKMNPNASTALSDLWIETHPFSLSHGYVDYGPALFSFYAYTEDNPPVDTDVNLGQFTYGNPYPSDWPLIAEYQHFTTTPYPTSGGSEALGGGIFQITDALPTLDAPIEPVIGPVTEVSVDESDFFANGTISTTPTISWSAPEVGTAQGYYVQVLQLSDGLYTEYGFRTTETSVKIPAGILQPSNSYVFAVIALNEGGKDLSATPFMTGFPHAYATASSGVFTVSAPEIPTVRAAAAKPLAGFRPKHVRTKNLGVAPRQRFGNPMQRTPRNR